MQCSDSVSKGFFIYKPEKTGRKSKKKSIDPILDVNNAAWYNSYHYAWQKVEEKLKVIGNNITEGLLDDIINFIHNAEINNHLIPTSVILTGVNLPDHDLLFNCLELKLAAVGNPLVAMISSSDCSTIKQTIELIVSQFIFKTCTGKRESENARKGLKTDMEWEDVEDNDFERSDLVKKNDCTMPYLAQWYHEIYKSSTKEKQKLVIVFKDFEGFQSHILHKLILIFSGYLGKLPLALVFGVATTEGAIGESLTHQCTSKLSLKVFLTEPSVCFLNNTLDEVFLTEDCLFQLSGKLLKFFTDVFLFYDFSVHQFIQGIKYCVMDHFFENNLIGLLCQDEKLVRESIKTQKLEELQDIKQFSSYKKYLDVHSGNTRNSAAEDVSKAEVMFMLSTLRKAIAEFYICLRILHALVVDLPQSPLGKQLRELYCISMRKDISKTPEYLECQQYLNFMSKDELEKKIIKIQKIISVGNTPKLKELKNSVNQFLVELEQIDSKASETYVDVNPDKIDFIVKNRSQLKQKLAEIGSRPIKKFGYEALREKIVKYFMCSFLPKELFPYPEFTSLWEAILIRDIDARNRVVPRIRAPIHTALNNPQHYLQCKCCEISDENSILPGMPDLCIAYKLHLEGGPVINIYDWLKSFSLIIDFKKDQRSEDANGRVEEVNEKVQARFTQALAELEFLGFIKSSKTKPDHVSRLTWGSTS